MKICSTCGISKTNESFSVNKSKNDGLASICKNCHSTYRKQDYLKNKEKVIKQVNKYKVKNPDKYNKKSGQTIKSSCKLCGEEMYITKKDVSDKKQRYCSVDCKNNDYTKDYYRYLKDVEKRAIKTNKEFNLTEEFIKDLIENKQQNKCKITNVNILIKNKNNKTSIYNTASLDRINNNKGYLMDNVQWVCLGINYMKSKFSDGDLFEMLKLIRENYKG